MQEREHSTRGVIADHTVGELHEGILQLEKLRIVTDVVGDHPFQKIEAALIPIDPQRIIRRERPEGRDDPAHRQRPDNQPDQELFVECPRGRRDFGRGACRAPLVSTRAPANERERNQASKREIKTQQTHIEQCAPPAQP